MGSLLPSNPARSVSSHLSFHVADTAFGIPIHRVREVIPYAAEARVPPSPGTVRGVMTIGGRAMPLVDLGLKFRQTEVVASDRTAVVIVEVREALGTLRFGLVADRVDSVVELTVEDVDPPPHLDSGIRTDWLEGLGRLGKEPLLLLDLDRILTEHERLRIGQLTSVPQSH